MKTFDDLTFKFRKGISIIQARMDFPNGYGISVVSGDGLYCDDTFEVAVFKDGHYDTPITDDVLGYQTQEDITKIMIELQNYEKTRV